MQAAEALGVEPARLLKTLMARAGKDIVCVLLPSDRELNLKRFASAGHKGRRDAAAGGGGDGQWLSRWRYFATWSAPQMRGVDRRVSHVVPDSSAQRRTAIRSDPQATCVLEARTGR